MRAGPSATQLPAALVVGGADSGDADRVVHLLTAEGRLAAFAPNAKRSRRRFSGALEPFTTIETQFAATRRKGGMPTLADATVLRARLPLRRHLDIIALASYFGELGFRTAPEGQATGVPELVEQGWERLMERPASLRLRRAFELRLLAELGYQPDLARCVVCGGDGGPVHLDLVRGGLLCDAHGASALRVGPKTLAWMTAALEAPELDADAGFDETWAETAARKLAGALGAFWTHLLDRPVNAAALLTDLGL